MRLRRWSGWVVCLVTSLSVVLLYARHHLLLDPLALEAEGDNDDDKDIQDGGEWRLKRYRPAVSLGRGQTPLPPEDELVDLRPFRFLIANGTACDQSAPYLLALVHSAPNHFLHRKVVRHTWASAKKIRRSVRVAFLLGDPLDGRIQAHLDEESRTHGDIVQGSFVDSYRNLTYKHVMGYMWVARHCPEAGIVMKVDDDVFVDIYRVVSVLLDTFPAGDHPPAGVLACCVVSEGTIPRQRGKWAVAESEYRFDTYPEYCSGMAYFVTPDLARDIYAATRYVPFFWIDDVYVTGCVAEALKVKRIHMNARYTSNETSLLHWLDHGTKPSSWMFAEVGPRHWADTMLRLWAKTEAMWSGQDGR